jgi:outer membrane protein, heavy metal efflux system
LIDFHNKHANRPCPLELDKSGYIAPFSKQLIAALWVALSVSSTHVFCAEPTALSIEQALTQLEQSNRTIQNSKRLTTAAQADVKRADVGPNPNVSIGVFNSVAGRYKYSELDQTLRIEQTFERGNKRALRVAAAQEIVRATEADINDITRQQKILGAGAYIDLMLSQRVQILSEENELNFKRLVDGALKRLKAGDIASADVSRLSVEQSRASNDVRSAQNAFVQAQFRLSALLAMESTPITASDKLPDIEFINRQAALLTQDAKDAAIAQATTSRSDLVAAQIRVKAAERAMAIAKSQTTRDITIGAQTERAPSFNGRVFGLSASVPLFTNNDYSGDILRAAADLSIAEGDVERIRAQIKYDVDAAFAQLSSAKDRLNRLLNTTLPEVNKASQAIEYAYTRGAATLTDLFDARRQYNAVLVETASAQADFARALYSYKATIEG